MVEWECPTNPREASGLDPEAVHSVLQRNDWPAITRRFVYISF